MNGTMAAYGSLLAAILCEVAGTTALKASEGFTRPLPTLVMAIGYGCSFYLLTIVMRAMPVGVAYAVWSGLGIVLISLVGFCVFGQRLDFPACIGLALIIAGVLVINLFSKSAGH